MRSLIALSIPIGTARVFYDMPWKLFAFIHVYLLPETSDPDECVEACINNCYSSLFCLCLSRALAKLILVACLYSPIISFYCLLTFLIHSDIMLQVACLYVRL